MNRPTLEQRIAAKVDRTDGCWLWTGFIDKAGYARVKQGARGTSVLYVHRWMYEQSKGPIPLGFHTDHLCRVRHCVNPDHLEAVTPRENVLRGEAPNVQIHRSGQCIRGHELVRRDFPSGTVWRCYECRQMRRAGVL